MPHSPKHALQLDEEHGNDNWQRSIKKELDEINEYETFRLPKEGESLNGFQHIPYHLVFDVKFDGRHKSRLVCRGKPNECGCEVSCRGPTVRPAALRGEEEEESVTDIADADQPG